VKYATIYTDKRTVYVNSQSAISCCSISHGRWLSRWSVVRD